MKKILSSNYTLSIISGILFIPGWYEWGTGFTLFLAFIPLFIIMDRLITIENGGRKMFWLAFLAFAIWNIGDTWWIRNALVDGKPSYFGVGAAVVLTSLLMSISTWLSFQSYKAWGPKTGLFAFIVFWLAYEFSYIHGEVSWPWLALGDGFAYEVKIIQWYEYTGVLGGSLWVLLINVFLFYTFYKKTSEFNFSLKAALPVLIIIVFPLTFSIVRYSTYKEIIDPQKIIVVQPNIDPYLKFNNIPSIEQTRIQVELARQMIDSTIDFVVAPETSIPNREIWIGRFDEVPDFKMIRDFQSHYPKMRYVTGITCYTLYLPGEKITPTANVYSGDYYFDSHNSAIQIDSTDGIQLYHKSKLVVGVEKMPYPNILKILKPLTLTLGGTFRSHAGQDHREVFVSPGGKVKIAPVICYESVYGEYVTDYVKLGANLIFVITNDGWWGNTPGHRQHNSLSRIRAIETRRSIARSANTGMSSFINQRGDVLQSLSWWKRGAMVQQLNVNNKITFYVKYGDYIGRFAFYSSILLLVILIFRKIQKILNKKSKE